MFNGGGAGYAQLIRVNGDEHIDKCTRRGDWGKAIKWRDAGDTEQRKLVFAIRVGTRAGADFAVVQGRCGATHRTVQCVCT